MIHRLGARNAEIGEPGSFNVTPGSFEVVEYHRADGTTPFTRAANAVPYADEVAAFARPMANSPLCDILPCGILGALGIECCEQRTSWNDPRILVDAIPVRIPTATVYVNPLNARVEGDVRLRVENSSERGERCTSIYCKCRSGTRPDCDTVRGSATTDGEDDHRLVVDRLDEVLDRVSSSFSNVSPNVEVTREASFTKEGALETVEAILDLLTTGTIDIDADINVTARVAWRGRTLTRQFDTSARVRLPVDNVNYRW